MRTRSTRFVVGTGLTAFVVLTILVWTGAADGLDRAAWHYADRHDSPAGRTVARVVTDVLSPVVDTIVLLAGAALLARRQRRMQPLLVAAGAVLVVSGVVLGVKYAVDRPLPHTPGNAHGFPSGHTAATLSFLGTLAVLASAGRASLRRRLLAVVGALTALVVAALVYAGFHWLTDTIASVVLGIAVVAAVVQSSLCSSPKV
jgi:membrane-associated phospholipid phosphatase